MSRSLDVQIRRLAGEWAQATIAEEEAEAAYCPAAAPGGRRQERETYDPWFSESIDTYTGEWRYQ